MINHTLKLIFPLPSLSKRRNIWSMNTFAFLCIIVIIIIIEIIIIVIIIISTIHHHHPHHLNHHHHMENDECHLRGIAYSSSIPSLSKLPLGHTCYHSIPSHFLFFHVVLISKKFHALFSINNCCHKGTPATVQFHHITFL